MLSDVNPVPLTDPSIILDPYDQARQRLISGTVPQDELPSIIETIFSDEKAANMVDCLQENDIQTFIDALDVVWYHTLPLSDTGSIDLCFNLLRSVG